MLKTFLLPKCVKIELKNNTNLLPKIQRNFWLHCQCSLCTFVPHSVFFLFILIIIRYCNAYTQSIKIIWSCCISKSNYRYPRSELFSQFVGRLCLPGFYGLISHLSCWWIILRKLLPDNWSTTVFPVVKVRVSSNFRVNWLSGCT